MRVTNYLQVLGWSSKYDLGILTWDHQSYEFSGLITRRFSGLEAQGDRINNLSLKLTAKATPEIVFFLPPDLW